MKNGIVVQVLLPVILGAIAGAVVTGLSVRDSASVEPDVAGAGRSRPATDRGSDARTEQQVRALERDLLALRDRVDASRAAGPGPAEPRHQTIPVATEAPEAPPDPEREREESRARWGARMDAFEEQDVDQPWAVAASQHLSQRVDPIVERFGGTVEALECRTSQCRVDLTWSGIDDLRHGTVDLLHQKDVDYNCARHVFMDLETSTSTLLIDCAS